MIRSCLRSVAISLLTLVASLAAAVARVLTGGERIPAAVVEWWGRTFVRIGGWTVRIEGSDRIPEGGGIVAANHQSLVDIPLLLTALPRDIRFLAKRELARIPLFGTAMAASGNLFVERGDPRDAVHMMRRAAELLRRGTMVVVFPEGTRSGDGAIGEFRPGAFHIAWKTGVPVVPVYLEGGRRALPKGSLRVRPAELLVHVLPPVRSDAEHPLSREEMAEETRRRILAAKAEEEGRCAPAPL